MLDRCTFMMDIWAFIMDRCTFMDFKTETFTAIIKLGKAGTFFNIG